MEIEAHKRRTLKWELAGIPFIFLAGSILHFVFEWTGCWRPVAVIAAVNESVWEHLKLSFWPGVMFAAFESAFVRRSVNNFWSGKAMGLLVMPIVIGVGFYGYTAVLGDNYLTADIVLFLVAVVVGQLASYRIMVARRARRWMQVCAAAALATMIVIFSLASYVPPRVFLFEDSASQGYGIPEGCDADR